MVWGRESESVIMAVGVDYSGAKGVLKKRVRNRLVWLHPRARRAVLADSAPLIGTRQRIR